MIKISLLLIEKVTFDWSACPDKADIINMRGCFLHWECFIVPWVLGVDYDVHSLCGAFLDVRESSLVVHCRLIFL